MRHSLLHLLAASGAFLLAAATSNAHAQTAWTSQLQGGAVLPAGQMHSWAFNVPAGNFVAFGRVSYRLDSGQDSGAIRCYLKRINTDEFWDLEQASITGSAQNVHSVEGEITLMSQVPVPAPGGSLVIQCRGEGGATGAQRIHDVRLELIAVRNLNNLSEIDTSGTRAPVSPRNPVRGRHN